MLKKILIITLFLTCHAFANKETDRVRLTTLIADYETLQKNTDDLTEKINSAKKIYRFYPKVYGKKTIGYANTAYTLAQLYAQRREYRDAQDDQIRQEKTSNNPLLDMFYPGGSPHKKDSNRALGLYKKYSYVLMNKDTDITDADFEKYMKFVYYEKRIKRFYSKTIHFNNALKLAKRLDYSIEKIADIETDYALASFKSYNFDVVKRYMNSAKQKILQHYGKNHYKYAEILILSGMAEQSSKKKSNTSEQYAQAMEVLDNYDQTTLDLKEETHKYLIKYYELIGKSDRATYHCRAVAKDYSLLPDQEIDPIYIVDPYFPRSSPSQRDIYMWSSNIEFTIDINGRPKDIEVIESSNEI